MCQLIPFILEEDYKLVAKDVIGKKLAIIFDDTTKDSEALIVLVRFVQEWEVKVRLVRFQLVQSSLSGDELSRIVIEVFHRKLNVFQGNLLAAMRDRASVNTKAVAMVSVLYPDMLDVGCISHFLDREGVKSNTPVLSTLMSSWNLIFTTSVKGRRVWNQITGRVMPRYNSIRWWSVWECAKVVFEQWRHIPTFLANDEEFAQASRRKLTEAVAQNPVQLPVELAALMELEKFVQARYTLEEDGALVFMAFEKLEELGALIHLQNFATLSRIVQELFPLNVAEQQRWYQYGFRECLMPAFQYCLATVANDPIESRSISVFRAAQLFSPRFVKASRPSATDIDRV